MKTLLATALLCCSLALTLFCPGCLTIKQSLVFNQDSSCIMTYEYSFPEEQLALWQEVESILGDKYGEISKSFLDEQSARIFFSDNGLELRQYRQYAKNKLMHIEIIVLARDAQKAVNSGIFGDFQLHQDALGDQLFKGRLNPLPDDLPAAALERLQKYAAGLNMSLRLKSPTALIRSNGLSIDYRQTEWAYAWPPQAEAASIFAPKPLLLEAKW
ncbi:MAG: hypothetical protein PHG44_03995 [Lentisphaeria bacterium]|jgi:hypothetical protein|nr:hypothetical protein [Lentisphaeria bacterium]MDY0176063.1 hypothetical protein [Lentisphaeria bacterium]